MINKINFIWPFNEHKKPRFDNNQDAHMSSENHEKKSDYGLNLDFCKPSHTNQRLSMRPDRALVCLYLIFIIPFQMFK